MPRVSLRGSRELLIVEDADEDYAALRRAFLAIEPVLQISRADDGDAALADLRATPVGEFPGAIVLDLGLPGTPGIEVLRELKADAQLSHIPVIVLTGSHRSTDVEGAYQLGASCYIEKTSRAAELVDAVAAIKGYWHDRLVTAG